MYRLDLPREEADAVLVSADMDVDPGITLHTFGHVRNSTDDHWIDVALRQHLRLSGQGRKKCRRDAVPAHSFTNKSGRRFAHLSLFLSLPLSLSL